MIVLFHNSHRIQISTLVCLSLTCCLFAAAALDLSKHRVSTAAAVREMENDSVCLGRLTS